MSRIYEEVDPKYATACSDITLCSNAKGFFKELGDELVALAEASDWLQVFEKVEPIQKVEAVMENKEIMSAISEVLSRVQPLYRGKDARASQERRLAAQRSLQQEDLDTALQLASQAVLRAPPTGVEEVFEEGLSLALALWTRSEVLLGGARPQAALADLRLALKERLPAKMRSQYYWRMGHCYKGAGEPTRAKVSYELAGRLLGKDEAAREQLASDIASLDYTAIPSQPPKKPGIKVSGGAKPNMPALSKLVKISEEENKGRFAVATSAVHTGDVLLVDSPYAACLLPDKYSSHCLHCFKRLEDSKDEASMWCPKCSSVAFCSIRCRDAAVSTYHAHECQFLDLFIGSGMSVLSHIALRMVTQAGLETSLSIHSKYVCNDVRTVEGSAVNDIEGVAKKSKMKSRKERLNRSKKALRVSNEKTEKEEKIEDNTNLEENLELRAAEIYSLCSHSQYRKGADHLKRVIMAMLLTSCLKKGDFFKGSDKENITKVEKSICELVVRNLELLQFNAHEIYETVRGSHPISGSKAVYIAVGIYPTGALFNHECYPAVARYFEGQKIILRATRPLVPGEVVSENYGPHFLMRGLTERQRSLACRYWFRCYCRACLQDWPRLKLMNDGTPFIRCSNTICSHKFCNSLLPTNCPSCGVLLDHNEVKDKIDIVAKCVTQYQEGAKMIEEKRIEEAIACLSRAVDRFHEVGAAPHRETHLAQEALRACFAATGNIHVVRDIEKTDQQET